MSLLWCMMDEARVADSVYYHYQGWQYRSIVLLFSQSINILVLLFQVDFLLCKYFLRKGATSYRETSNLRKMTPLRKQIVHAEIQKQIVVSYEQSFKCELDIRITRKTVFQKNLKYFLLTDFRVVHVSRVLSTPNCKSICIIERTMNFRTALLVENFHG